MDEITQTLKQVRRRMVARIFLENLTRCCLIAGGVLLVVACGSYLLRGSPWNSMLAWIIAAGAFVAVLAATMRQAPSLEQTAGRIDRLADTRDRFLTAFAFAKTAARPPMQNLAIEECRRFIGGFNWQLFVRVQMPRRAAFILVPVVAILLLVWHSRLGARVQSPLAKQELSEKSRELEILAQKINDAAGQLQSEELKKIAEEMKKSAARLKAESSDNAAKSALRELSAIEAMVNQMKSKAAPGELTALAAALEQDAQANAAAKDIQSGDLQSAADKLDQLARQDDAALQKIAQAVEDALRKRGENPRTQIEQRMADFAKSSRMDRQQALKNLASALRQMSGSRQAQLGGGGDARSQAMQNLLGTLQDLKYSMQRGGEKKSSAQNSGGGKLLMQSPGGSKPENQLAIGPPSGQPGSEHDIGTTETPFGPEQKRAADPSESSQLNGVMGEGESLSDFTIAAGDDSKSAQRYRNIYNAMAPAAEDALTQENIPLGSRFFVKRYFQNIRPKE
jgi:uncharacterized membrane protein